MNNNSLLAKQTPRLAGFYFFYYATFGAFLPYWSLYLEKVGFDKPSIGILMAVTMLSRIFGPLVWGVLSDATGKRMIWVRLATLAEFVAWLAIFVIPKQFMAFFIIMLVFSFFQNAIMPQFEAVTLAWLGKARERYGHIRLWGSVGFIVTVFGLGQVFDWFDLALLPVLLAVISFLCFLNALIVDEPKTCFNEKISRMQAKTTPNALVKAHTKKGDEISFVSELKQPAAAWFYMAQFVLLLSHAPFYSFYSNYLGEHGYSHSVIGLLWGVGVVAEVVMFTQSKRVLTAFRVNQLVVACFLVTALRWVLVWLVPSSLAVQLLAQCCHAFSFALFQVIAMQFIYGHFSEAVHGRAQALYSSLWGLGVATGSVVVGCFWTTTGGGFWFLLSGALMAAFALVWYVLASQWRNLRFH